MNQVISTASFNFTVKSCAKWHLLRIGVEKTPVILIDNFLTNLEPVSQLAINARFQQEKSTYYPGTRAKLADSYIDFVLNQISPVIGQVYQLESVKAVAADKGYFSLVNQTAKKLKKAQCIPHFDSLNKRQFAIMHYINSGDFGGTGFYRHNPTGFENIEQSNLLAYQVARCEFEHRYGQPAQDYIRESTAEFKLLGKIAYKQNRLVIYPGTLLHSGLIEAVDLSDKPKTGRLTANIFAEFK